jgi:dimethylamine monooxygenase subunit A
MCGQRWMQSRPETQMPLVHTPYDGRAQPFSIGLRSIPAHCWILPDGLLLPELALKKELLAHRRDVVVREQADTRAAQTELLAMLAGHLAADHGGLFQRDGANIVIRGTGLTINLVNLHEPAIVSAARLVQDDLVLMRKVDDGWRLVAACLCFPSTWSLAEKFGQPMEAIHEAVPGYAGQMATRINRIFDHLPADQIVERFNWSIYGDDELHHPEPKSGPRPWQGLGAKVAEHAFIRVERQTLRRLPLSQDIVFTIRVHVDPVTAFREHPDGKVLARALSDQLTGLNPDQLTYKNMLADRDVLIGALSALAAS